MNLEILGCSGGIGGSARTSCLMVDGHTLIDAGSGAGDLALAQIVKLDHVFLTHSHLDHCAFLPFVADARIGRRAEPLIVHALPETWAALQACMFNGQLWPDYTRPDQPYVRFEPLRVHAPWVFEGGRVTPLPACHAVPAVGYHLEGRQASFATSGDSTYCEAFWERLAGIGNLRWVMLEATFLDEQQDRAHAAGHMTPGMIAQALARWALPADVLIGHMEPGREAAIIAQFAAHAPRKAVIVARPGMTFEL
ncbi:MAG: 3',5'-cyclic-nucleotide phosphodiesterase [Betaproteobacteria bacterium]|nr:3',5'-cyclic-nucleotide phosphodiesterase [Betaproteobacteria bacterium]